MISTLQLATLGLSPGFNTFECATLGYNFRIIITVSSQGGSDLEAVDIYDSRRLVTIEVWFKQHKWTQSIWIDNIVIDKLVNIKGFLRSIHNKIINVSSNISKVKSKGIRQ